MTAQLTADEDAFYDDFITQFFSVDGELVVAEGDRQEAVVLAKQASKAAALEAMASFAFTEFRDDLAVITVPTLVIQGDGDATVPFEGSGARTHAAIPGWELSVIAGGRCQSGRRMESGGAGVPRAVDAATRLRWSALQDLRWPA